MSMHLTYSGAQSILEPLVTLTYFIGNSQPEQFDLPRAQPVQVEVTREFLWGEELGEYSHNGVLSESAITTITPAPTVPSHHILRCDSAS
jgi:hypothetical protein